MLSVWTKTWCPIRSGSNALRAKQTALISRQLMCYSFSGPDQRPETGLLSYNAPQPRLKASVNITFLLGATPMVTLDWYQFGAFQGARALIYGPPSEGGLVTRVLCA